MRKLLPYPLTAFTSQLFIFLFFFLIGSSPSTRTCHHWAIYHHKYPLIPVMRVQLPLLPSKFIVAMKCCSIYKEKMRERVRKKLAFDEKSSRRWLSFNQFESWRQIAFCWFLSLQRSRISYRLHFGSITVHDIHPWINNWDWLTPSLRFTGNTLTEARTSSGLTAGVSSCQ